MAIPVERLPQSSTSMSNANASAAEKAVERQPIHIDTRSSLTKGVTTGRLPDRVLNPQKYRRRQRVAAATALTTLGIVGVGVDEATHGGVREAIPFLGGHESNSHRGEEISGRVFEVEVSAYPSYYDHKDTYRTNNVVVPRVDPEADSSRISLEAFNKALPTRPLRGQLVLGASYPGPDRGADLVSEVQRERTQVIQKSWEEVLKANGIEENYWSFEKDGEKSDKKYGVWVKFHLEKPILVDGKPPIFEAYLSLNQVLPTSKQK